MNVDSSFICNHQKLETTQMPLSGKRLTTLWSTRSMDYYSVIKRNIGLQQPAGSPGVMLSEDSPSPEATCHRSHSRHILEDRITELKKCEWLPGVKGGSGCGSERAAQGSLLRWKYSGLWHCQDAILAVMLHAGAARGYCWVGGSWVRAQRASGLCQFCVKI